MTAVCHVVLVSWRNGRGSETEDFIRPIVRGFTDTISGVLNVVEGHSSSPEGLEGGFEYALVVTFATAQARDAYLDDPVHRPVADAIGEAAEKVVVFDI